MPAIFHRLDDELIEVLPTYPSNLPISGRYVVDFPDHFDLKTDGSKPNRAQVIEKVDALFKEKFVSFDYFQTNNFLTNTNFTDNFEDVSSGLSISIVDDQFAPVSPANPEFNFLNSYKFGSEPNTLSVMGRFPHKNHLDGVSLTSNKNAAGNRCILTKEIDVSAQTSDGLGRNDFFIYFRSALKSYTKDSSLSDTERNSSSTLTTNQTGSVSYTNTQYDSEHRLRCFISGDGSTYQEIENLKVFSFNGRVDKIRLTWVNYTDADLTLLSYTLMY